MRRFGFYIILFLIAVLVNAQTVTTTIALLESDCNKILNILKDITDGECTFSNLKISNAHLSTFIESADYGSMWYGDTVKVNQVGYLIQYDYRKVAPKWELSESFFILNDKSAIYRKYACHFGDSPKNHGHGYANRRVVWNTKFEAIMSILNKKEHE